VVGVLGAVTLLCGVTVNSVALAVDLVLDVTHPDDPPRAG